MGMQIVGRSDAGRRDACTTGDISSVADCGAAVPAAAVYIREMLKATKNHGGALAEQVGVKDLVKLHGRTSHD